jgi:hypothetical protein
MGLSYVSPPPLGAQKASAGCVCDLRRPACGGETRGVGNCEDVESFAMPPTSDELTRPNGDMEYVFSDTADTLKSIARQLGILLADEGSSSD